MFPKQRAPARDRPLWASMKIQSHREICILRFLGKECSPTADKSRPRLVCAFDFMRSSCSVARATRFPGTISRIASAVMTGAGITVIA